MNFLKLLSVVLFTLPTLSYSEIRLNNEEENGLYNPHLILRTETDDPKIYTNSNISLNAAPLALVYNGNGACDHCYKDAAEAANKNGYAVRYVNGALSDYSVFDRAAVWVQPGGYAVNSAQAMGKKLMNKVRDYVKNGGGFVGYCAGAFIATPIIGTSGYEGLGIINGNTQVYRKEQGSMRIIGTKWNNKYRRIYFSGGPELLFDEAQKKDVNIFAYYMDGKIAAASGTYGAGKFSVSGPHPETSKSWKFWHGLKDSDGSDQWIAGNMMKSVQKK